MSNPVDPEENAGWWDRLSNRFRSHPFGSAVVAIFVAGSLTIAGIKNYKDLRDIFDGSEKSADTNLIEVSVTNHNVIGVDVHLPGAKGLPADAIQRGGLRRISHEVLNAKTNLQSADESAVTNSVADNGEAAEAEAKRPSQLTEAELIEATKLVDALIAGDDVEVSEDSPIQRVYSFFVPREDDALAAARLAFAPPPMEPDEEVAYVFAGTDSPDRFRVLWTGEVNLEAFRRARQLRSEVTGDTSPTNVEVPAPGTSGNIVGYYRFSNGTVVDYTMAQSLIWDSQRGAFSVRRLEISDFPEPRWAVWDKFEGIWVYGIVRKSPRP